MQKVTVADFVFYMKNWEGHLTQFCPMGGGNLNKLIFHSSNKGGGEGEEGLPREMLKL